MKARELREFWDSTIAEFLDADIDPRTTRPELALWAQGYHGRGRGQVTPEGMPEPYLGPLAGPVDARVVMLGLNPGRQAPEFQSRTGLFADEIREMGSYSAWAATAPYLRDPWTARQGRNRYHHLRLQFARRWAEDDSITGQQLLLLELFPWHSIAVTSLMAPDPGIIREFIWQPIADTGVPVVFALGADWGRSAETLQLRARRLTVPFSVPTRQVRCYELPSGQDLIVLWHSGSADPPAASDVRLLRGALQRPA